MSTPIFWNTSQTSPIDVGIPITSSVSLLKYWAFSQYWRSVATASSINSQFTFLAIATFAFSFLEWASKSLASVVSLAIRDPKLTSVFRIRCTSSASLSVSSTHIHLHVTTIKKKIYHLQDSLTN